MTSDASLPPPSRPRRQPSAAPVRPRRECPCRAPLPPLPRSLRRRGLHLAPVQFLEWPHSLEAVQVTPESLDPEAVGRLFARVEARRHRVRAWGARVAEHWFWIRVELALILPRLHPNARDRWLEWVRIQLRHAAWHLDDLRQLEALALSHEPETDAWLRRQLAALGPQPSA